MLCIDDSTVSRSRLVVRQRTRNMLIFQTSCTIQSGRHECFHASKQRILWGGSYVAARRHGPACCSTYAILRVQPRPRPSHQHQCPPLIPRTCVGASVCTTSQQACCASLAVPAWPRGRCSRHYCSACAILRLQPRSRPVPASVSAAHTADVRTFTSRLHHLSADVLRDGCSRGEVWGWVCG